METLDKGGLLCHHFFTISVPHQGRCHRSTVLESLHAEE